MTLSVRPQQIEDESLAGYLLRLSVRNGYMEANDWLNDRLVHNVTCSSIKLRQQSQLENSIGRTVITHPILFTGNISPLFISPVFTSPRLCPMCIRENAYFKQIWQHVGNLYCDKHMCLLEDSCHNCLRPFKWHKDIFINKCTSPNCISSIITTPVSEQIRSFGSQEIFDCYLADLFWQSPNTSLLHKTKHPSFNLLSDKVSRGFALLTDKEQIARWFEKFSTEAHLKAEYPKDLHFYSAELLLNSLQCDWLIKRILPKLLERTQLPEIVDMTYPALLEVTSQVLSKKLELSLVHFKEVMSLLEPCYQHNKIISPVHPINVSSIFYYLLKHRKPITNTITLQEAAKDNEVQRTKLFKAVFSNTIDFDYRPQEDILRSILLPSAT